MRLVLNAIRPALTACALFVTTVAGVELGLRLFKSPSSQGLSGQALFHGNDGMSIPCDIAFQRLKSVATLTSIDPDSGDAVAVAVNSHGLRGPEIAVPKPAGVYRVLCLGDETVFGPCVEEDQTITARLNHLLQARSRYRIEVLNGGVPGDCPLLAWLRLRHSLLALQPDLIILHVDMSDVDDDRFLRRHTRLAPDQTPMACPHPAFARRDGDRPWWRNLAVTESLSRLAGSYGPADGAATGRSALRATGWIRDSPTDWDLYVQQSLAPLADIQRAAQGIGAALVVTTSPQPWQVSAEASNGPGVREAAGIAPGLVFRSRSPFNAVRSAAETQQIQYCDVSAAFLDFPEPERLYFRNAAVLSRLGNELFARNLCEFLGTQLPVFGADGHLPSPTGDSTGRVTISQGGGIP